MTTKNLTIVGLVLSFFIPLAGVIISAIALKRINEENNPENSKGMAIAGIVIGAVLMAISLISSVCIILGGFFALGSMG